MRRAIALSLALTALLAAAPRVWAQGFLVVENARDRVMLPRPVPRPARPPVMSYKIKELAMDARVTDQVARVQVSQTFVNTGSRQMEVSFVFPLPYDGAVDRLTFLVDGQEYEAKLMPAKQARTIYEGYIRRNQDPALLEWIGTGMFKTSVFPVPPGAERKVTLRYNQLLRKDHGLTDLLFPLGAAKYTDKPVEQVAIRASIQSSTPIKNVYSPTHSVEIKRPTEMTAVVSFSQKNTIPSSDFRLFYDVGSGQVGASVISYRPDKGEDGYFLLLATPQFADKAKARPSKDVICVFDRSGSMSGKKIEQAREALKFILNNLKKGDRFNVVAYDSAVESFRDKLQPFTDQNRKEALGFVEGLYAGGGTNISGALETSLKMLSSDKRPAFVIFLTDGRPTIGETNEAKIVVATKKHNQARVRLISFGVGFDVNSRLLDRLSRSNHGQSQFVRPNEDIETHVSRVYSRISSPVLSNVNVKFETDTLKVEDGSLVNRQYPGDINDLFEGEQLVILGRYKQPGVAKVVISGKVGDKEHKFDFPARLAAESNDQSYAFVEKLWAMRRIGQIIDEIDLHGQNKELIDELVALSTKHGILTPYTSYLADDQARAEHLAQNGQFGGREARERLRRLAEAGGKAGFLQRDLKNRLQNAERPTADAVSGPAPGEAKGEGQAAGGGVATKPNASTVLDLEKDKVVAVDSVQNVGNKTYYKRGNVWYGYDAAREDLKKLADKIKTITRFSKEYFELVKQNTAAENVMLSRQQAGEELVVKLRGQIYRIK